MYYRKKINLMNNNKHLFTISIKQKNQATRLIFFIVIFIFTLNYFLSPNNLNRYKKRLIKSRYRVNAPINASFWVISSSPYEHSSILFILFVSYTVSPTKIRTPAYVVTQYKVSLAQKIFTIVAIT